MREYASELIANLLDAARAGCAPGVQQIAVELAALTRSTVEFFAELAAEDAAGTLDVLALEEAAALLGAKWLALYSQFDRLVEDGGGPGEYATLVRDGTSQVAFAVAAWEAFGIDSEAETYDLGVLEEFGFSEPFSFLRDHVLTTADRDLSEEYC